MHRYNIFLPIHKGLRAMMYDTSLSLQQTDFGQMNYSPQSLEKLTITLDTFDEHAKNENNCIFSTLESCARRLMAEMRAEHATDQELIDELKGLMAAYKDATDACKRYEIGSEICCSFNQFVAFNLLHLNEEETFVNEALWSRYTDKEIEQLDQHLISGLEPEAARNTITWMMRSCRNSEISRWINAIKDNIPVPMFQMIMLIAEQELPAHRFEAIQDGVMQAV